MRVRGRGLRSRVGRSADKPTPPQLTPIDIARQVARDQSWSSAPPRQLFFKWLAAAIAANRDGCRVLVAADGDAAAWQTMLRTAWPDVSVTVVGSTADESTTHAELTSAAPFDILIQADDVDAMAQVRLFRALFFHLRAGGTFLCPRMVPRSADDTPPDQPRRHPLPNEDLPEELVVHGDLWDVVAESQHARLSDYSDDAVARTLQFRDARGLGRHLRKVEVDGRMLRIENQLRTQAKLTESEANAVLELRQEFGTALTTRDAASSTAVGPYVHNLGEGDPWFSPTTSAPLMTLRRYDGPTVSHGSVVTTDCVLWPDTFRHSTYPRLTNIYVEEAAPRFGSRRRDVSNAVELDGVWFHLDSEWPGHFGHLLTEQLGRMWAWPEARERFPGIKVLFNVQHDRPSIELLPFETDLFAAFDIEPDDVLVYRNPCRPQTLVAATSMMSVADYLHPDLLDVWRTVGDRLAARGADPGFGRRIFCTRPDDLKRSCRNTAEVEELFRRHGFAIVRPELFSLPDQVAMFRAADVVAGFAGSALFTLAFCPEPKDVFTVAPLTYTARNEQLICGALGHRLVSSWSAGDEQHPAGSWSNVVFAASFTFDPDVEGRFLDEQLRALG